MNQEPKRSRQCFYRKWPMAQLYCLCHGLCRQFNEGPRMFSQAVSSETRVSLPPDHKNSYYILHYHSFYLNLAPGFCFSSMLLSQFNRAKFRYQRCRYFASLTFLYNITRYTYFLAIRVIKYPCIFNTNRVTINKDKGREFVSMVEASGMMFMLCA